MKPPAPEPTGMMLAPDAPATTVPAPRKVLGNGYSKLLPWQRRIAQKHGLTFEVFEGKQSAPDDFAEKWALSFADLPDEFLKDMKMLGYNDGNWGKPLEEVIVTDDRGAI
jgi:hypothetical protein